MAADSRADHVSSVDKTKVVEAFSSTQCRSILMVGTHPNTKGGISAVVRGYREGGLFERFDCRYVITHRDGSALQKLLTALRGLGELCVLLSRYEGALVHVHLSSRASFWRKSVACMLAMAARRPYLLHVHGSEFMQFYNDECGPMAKRAVRLIFARASLILALSEQWRESLMGICSTAPVEVLPNAVRLPDLETVVGEHGEEPVILFLGRLGTRKGTFDLVRAFAAVRRRFPRTRLVCAGDGPIEEVRALARSLGLEAAVDCPGWLDPERTRQALRRATLFALPSRAEGLPMAMLEAMSWALPVVSTPVGGIPQVLKHGENGWLIQPGDIQGLADALCELIDDADIRNRLGMAARSTIEHSFSLAVSIDRLSQIYDRFGVSSHVYKGPRGDNATSSAQRGSEL